MSQIAQCYTFLANWLNFWALRPNVCTNMLKFWVFIYSNEQDDSRFCFLSKTVCYSIKGLTFGHITLGYIKSRCLLNMIFPTFCYNFIGNKTKDTLVPRRERTLKYLYIWKPYKWQYLLLLLRSMAITISISISMTTN